jgi:hypothetical protein
LDNTNSPKIRFRKTLMNSKIRKPGGIDIDPERFMNYIVEPAPSLADKLLDTTLTGGRALTDRDAVGIYYGRPCPPYWIPKQDGTGGVAFIPPDQYIPVDNGFGIPISSIMRALWAYPKAKSLLKDWKFYKNPVVLTLEEGKVTEIKPAHDVAL